MSRFIISLDPRSLIVLIMILAIVILSAYVIATDLSVKYEWYYPLDETRSIGFYYPKSSRIVTIYNLETNEITQVSYTGLVIGGIDISKSNSSYAKVEYSGVNFYVLVVTALVILAELTCYIKVKKIPSLHVLILFVVLSVLSVLALVSTLYYIDLGHEYGFTARTYEKTSELLGPYDVKNITTEGLANLTLLFEFYRYLYLCPGETFQENTLVSVKIEDPIHVRAFTIPLVQMNGENILSYRATSYLKGETIRCALFSMSNAISTTYTIRGVSFYQNPAVSIIPLFFALPLAIIVMILGITLTTLALSRRVKNVISNN
ncbi:MAG: hypothetical protein QXI85_07975 [Desulfurococcaceae archaeon]